jgi:hypothetical protein
VLLEPVDAQVAPAALPVEGGTFGRVPQSFLERGERRGFGVVIGVLVHFVGKYK